MKFRYDKKFDIAYITLSEKAPVKGYEVEAGVILHKTSQDEIVEIEIHDASERFPIQALSKIKFEKLVA